MASNDKTQRDSEVDALRAENERLRGQLAEATSRAANLPAAKPFLTEGERQDLLTFGVTTGTGGRTLSLTDAKAMFPDVDFTDASDVAKNNDTKATAEAKRPAVRGVDFVYPSVEPGRLDPEAAGRPGISGPAAK